MENQNQLGGHGTKFINYSGEKDETRNITPTMLTLQKGIILNALANQKTIDYNRSVHLNSLDKLLCLDETTKTINIDFLSKFRFNMYNDTFSKGGGLFAMKNNKFVQNNKLNYEMNPKSVATGGGGAIFFVTDRSQERNLVLKLIPIEPQIYDYLSLQIVRIVDKTDVDSIQLQNNYYIINKDTYKAILDKDDGYETLLNGTHISDTSRTSKVLFGCKTSNFYNENIINLIIEKICLDYKHTDIYKFLYHYVKYINFYAANVNGTTQGVILMDRMDADAGKLYKRIVVVSNDMVSSFFIQNLFNQISPLLTLLKLPQYNFTHTDMKLENIFYKKNHIESTHENQIRTIHTEDNITYGIYSNGSEEFFCDNIDNSWNYYVFYLADFDKSSITYNGVRFYNDMDGYRRLTGAASPNTYESLVDFRVGNDNTKFGFNRALVSVQSETINLRYLIYPFYSCFDYQSLWISIFIYTFTLRHGLNVTTAMTIFTRIRDLAQNISTFFPNDQLKNMLDMYESKQYPPDKIYEGDFGQMLDAFVGNSKDIFFLHNIDAKTIQRNITPGIHYFSKPIKNVTRVLISDQQNKLIVSIPFVPLRVLARMGTTSLTNAYTVVIHPSLTKELYKDSDIDGTIVEEMLTPFINNNNINIYYEGGQHIGGHVTFNGCNIIVQTNRYTNMTIGGAGLYEYDNIYYWTRWNYNTTEGRNQVMFIFRYFLGLVQQYARKYLRLEWYSEYAILYDTMENFIKINNVEQITDIMHGLHNIFLQLNNYSESNKIIVTYIQSIMESYRRLIRQGLDQEKELEPTSEIEPEKEKEKELELEPVQELEPKLEIRQELKIEPEMEIPYDIMKSFIIKCIDVTWKAINMVHISPSTTFETSRLHPATTTFDTFGLPPTTAESGQLGGKNWKHKYLKYKYKYINAKRNI